MILLLNLLDITVVHGRIEKLTTENECGLFDILIARAFATLEPLLKLAAPLLKQGGQLIAEQRRGEGTRKGAITPAIFIHGGG